MSILFMYVYTTFDTFNIINSVTLYVCLNIFYFSQHLWHTYFIVICNILYSMQHALLTLSAYPVSCKKELFHIPVFGRKISLIFLIIYQLTCQWVLANLTQLSLWPLLTGPWMKQLFSFNQFGAKSEQFSQLAHRFHRNQMYFGFFWPLRHWFKLYIQIWLI